MEQTRIKNGMRVGGTLILTALLGLSMLVAPKYEARAETANEYDRTAIEDDLKGVALDGYQKNESGTPSLITFSEYCYSNDEEVAQKYGLYFYVYNPAEAPLSVKAGANEINMATAYNEAGEPSGYENCALTYLDATDNNRFYKFKLAESDATLTRARAYATAHGGVRRYDFAGLQLWTAGASGAKDYGVSATYRCTGYGAGCDILGSQKSTLAYEASKLETIELDIRQTYYRQEGINQNGAGHHNQLSSVYFAIPKDKLKNYGGLYAVKCSWDEARTAPIIVTNRQEVYDDVKAHIGTDGSGGAYEIYDNYYTPPGSTILTPTADWSYNVSYKTGGFSPAVNVQDRTPVGYVFKSGKSDVKETEIGSDEIQAWITAHGNANYLFAKDVDSGRQYGKQVHTFKADELFDILTFNATSSGWDKFCMGWQQFWSGKRWEWGEDDLNVEPIKHVTDDDFKGTDVRNASGLFVSEADYGAFKTFYDGKKAQNDVFLLRFAVTDYYSNTQTVFTANDFFGIGDGTSTYMARETVFKQFDVIELTFRKEGKETVIGVVESPVDIVGGIDAPNYEEGKKRWQIMLAIVLLVAVVIVAYKIVKGVLSLIFKG